MSLPSSYFASSCSTVSVQYSGVFLLLQCLQNSLDLCVTKKWSRDPSPVFTRYPALLELRSVTSGKDSAHQSNPSPKHLIFILTARAHYLGSSSSDPIPHWQLLMSLSKALYNWKIGCFVKVETLEISQVIPVTLLRGNAWRKNLVSNLLTSTCLTSSSQLQLWFLQGFQLQQWFQQWFQPVQLFPDHLKEEIGNVSLCLMETLIRGCW